MNKRQKIMHDYVAYWSRLFRVTQDIGVRFESYDMGTGDSPMPQFLRAEETVVTQLERAIMGEKAWKQMVQANHAPGTMGQADVDSIHYNRATITFYDPLMTMEDDKMFSLIGKSVSLHEVLHIVLSPLSLYCQTLEMK